MSPAALSDYTLDKIIPLFSKNLITSDSAELLEAEPNEEEGSKWSLVESIHDLELGDDDDKEDL